MSQNRAVAGRPTLRTPEVETDLVLLLANGLSIRSAARVVGVSRRSLTRWLAAGLAEKRIEDDPDFRRFAELIEQEGYVAKFEGTTYRYLRIGEDVFWTSRSL